MKKDLKLILIIITTLLLMFATSLLLDLQIVQQQFIRKVIVYVAITIQLLLGFLILKNQLQN
mgnify:CR=1 FL=1